MTSGGLPVIISSNAVVVICEQDSNFIIVNIGRGREEGGGGNI